MYVERGKGDVYKYYYIIYKYISKYIIIIMWKTIIKIYISLPEKHTNENCDAACVSSPLDK